MAPKKPSIKKQVRKAVRDVKAYAKRKGLKTKSMGGGGGGSGIFSQFEGAKYSNKRQWVNTPWPADAKRTMTTFDRQELTRKMRWLAVNAGLVRQMISDMCLYAVGDGIRPQAATGDEAIDRLYDEYFMDWANSPCDITGRFNFWECQQLMSRRVDIDGEIFILKTYSSDGRPKIQLIESHRVGASAGNMSVPENCWDGVYFNKFGAVVGYSVIRSDGTTKYVPANSILHVYHAESATGARAYSPMQHSINNLIDILEILSLEKVAMKVQSDVVRTITRENPQFDGSTADFEAFGMRPQDYPGKVYQNPEEVGAFIGGKTVALAPGEDLKMVESNRMAPNTLGAIEYLQRDSVMGVLPPEFVIEPNKAGAAMRLVVAKAERCIGGRQDMLKSRANNPIWGYVIGTAIARGELPVHDNWHRVNWLTSRRVTVDAGRESAANQKDVEMGLKTISDSYAEMGMDYRQEVRRRAADYKLIQDTAKEFGVPPSALFAPANTPLSDINDAAKTAEKGGSTASDYQPLFGNEPT